MQPLRWKRGKATDPGEIPLASPETGLQGIVPALRWVMRAG